jgi:hypothetical protein
MKININEYVTNKNATDYSKAQEKLIFLTDLLGCGVDHPAIDSLEFCLRIIIQKRKNIIFDVCKRMEQSNAGSFANAIAQAYYIADGANSEKLEEAFSDLFKRFMSARELELFRSTDEA